jgi:RNA polymerase sigma-70 factor (sigma-E family)
VPGNSTETIEAFSAYVAVRQHALVRTAFLLTGDHHSAEDLVQAALARTYLAWGRIRDDRAIDAYVRRIMINEHTSWWRRAWRHRERTTDEVPEPPPELEVDVGQRDEVWALVQTLPPKQRAVVVLRFYEDLTEADTADALGCSVGNVKSQTSRALVALRKRIANDGSTQDNGFLTTEGGTLR